MRVFIAIIVSAILALAGVAEAKPYTIKKGDTLSGIALHEMGSVKFVEDIAKANSQKIKNPKHIKAGWTIEIPDSSLAKKSVKVVQPVAKKLSVKKARMKKIYSVVKKVAGTIDNPAIYNDNEVGDDPWVGELIEALKLLGIDIPKNASLRFAFEGMDILPFGAIIQMVSGKNKVKWYRAELSPKKAEVRKLGIIVDRVRIGVVYLKPECANWLTRKEPPAPPVSAKPVEPTEPTEPIISRPVIEPFEPFEPFVPWVPEKPPQCRDFELSLGTGLLFGSEASMEDQWYYGEGMYWNSCWGWSLGAGFYFNGDFGDVDSPYEWDNFGIGPQVGLRYQGIIKDKSGVVHPFGWTAKLRLIWATATGENPES
ncbi:MAG: LysM peptidoglycan-binding domain-containing protein, partial [Candidatus Moranbacteria bacterium]|nr:LysM peptidoglycan-binding domain-containing protein [Candidatus Moranbacteria bacterium]